MRDDAYLLETGRVAMSGTLFMGPAFVAAIGSGIVGGIFYGFLSVVMKALGLAYWPITAVFVFMGFDRVG